MGSDSWGQWFPSSIHRISSLRLRILCILDKDVLVSEDE